MTFEKTLGINKNLKVDSILLVTATQRNAYVQFKKVVLFITRIVFPKRKKPVQYDRQFQTLFHKWRCTQWSKKVKTLKPKAIKMCYTAN